MCTEFPLIFKQPWHPPGLPATGCCAWLCYSWALKLTLAHTSVCKNIGAVQEAVGDCLNNFTLDTESCLWSIFKGKELKINLLGGG